MHCSTAWRRKGYGSSSHLAAEEALFPAEKLSTFFPGLVEFSSESLICHFWGPFLHPSPQLLQKTLLALESQFRSSESGARGRGRFFSKGIWACSLWSDTRYFISLAPVYTSDL